jgi:hypothetical protein
VPAGAWHAAGRRSDQVVVVAVERDGAVVGSRQRLAGLGLRFRQLLPESSTWSSGSVSINGAAGATIRLSATVMSNGW